MPEYSQFLDLRNQTHLNINPFLLLETFQLAHESCLCTLSHPLAIGNVRHRCYDLSVSKNSKGHSTNLYA